MKKFIIAITLVLCTFGAFAENENAATSKEYVDTELAAKQPTIPAEGNNAVMTFDSTADDGIGTKQIYDETASYATQENTLVTAATANAAVQMAIQGEFVCTEYSTIDPTDCWMWTIVPARHDAGISPGDGEWFRAYFTSEALWRYYDDASSSIRIPIKSNITYKLYWDNNYVDLFRVGFVKTDNTPTYGNPVQLYKSNGSTGYELYSKGASTRSITFTVSDDTIKYIIIQVTGELEPWTNGDFSALWNRISHLHLEQINYLPQNVQ